MGKYDLIGIGNSEAIVPIDRIPWDAYFMNMCEVVAQRSLDSNTKFGAIFVRDKRIIVTSYNSFPPNCPDGLMPNNRFGKYKYDLVNHAEESGILFAAKEGISLDGCTLYCQGHPCSSCARKLISVGVVNWVIGDRQYQLDEKELQLREFWVEVGKVKITKFK